MEFPFLRDLMIIFFLSAAVLFTAVRLHLHPIIGLMITGVISGPHGLQLITGKEQVEVLAGIGLILLLFTIGMEFPLKQITHMKHAFFIGGSIQVFLTCLCGFLVGQFLKRPLGESIFLGCLLSLSSTAIVLKLLTDRSEENSHHGKIILSILIFQDLISVPMLLIIPFLSGESHSLGVFDALFLIAKSICLLFFVYAFSIKIMPTILYHVTKSRSREMFILIVLAMCFSITWFSSIIGLPPSLGAFLAGLVLAESEYHYQVVGNILPLQDILISVFFISIGMLLDFHFFLQIPFIIFSTAIAVMLMKAFIAAITAIILKVSLRTLVATGLALAQIGEFSFVLANAGISHGIGSEFYYQFFLAVSLITMTFTAFLIDATPAITRIASTIPFFLRLTKDHHGEREADFHQKIHHVIIIGYGISGEHLASALKIAGIDYMILEMNPEIVLTAKSKGEPIYFGDATHDAVLHQLNLSHAQAVAIAIDDPTAAKRIVKKLHGLYPQLPIIVRTLHAKDANALLKLGAAEVIPCDAEATIRIFTRLLEKCSVQSEKIFAITHLIRSEMYYTFNHAKSSNLVD